ncbi:EamA family transporter RarD [Thalassobius vesicularis]|uniref:EamA family transporter RarD n=1 Tax=Thalassobius vesicularis TaxID=1294297 RepID=A0A4S3M7W8_9RHOB|nr:EamA family transporter RarD [Thalassobius vesicularis]THD72663.1 EamA family transporter RarD [Thalassobius vesicularis]
MTQNKSGILALVGACTVWGLSPLYYKLLAHIPPIEVLAHRTLWSFVFFAVVLMVQGRLGQLRTALGSVRSVLVIAFASLMISINWFFFIVSIQIGKATEASLGYYIFPLVAVLIGVVVFREKLGRLQILAVVLALSAVVVLTLGLGVAPWIALILSFSFGLYGLVKKWLSVGPVVSVTAEVLLIAPISLSVLLLAWYQGHATFGANWRDTGLLLFSGPLTATPLILFSAATKRVSMATVGLVQYLNPTLQFLCAVLIFGEPFGQWHAIAFALIWTALAIYTAGTWRQDRAVRRAAMASSGVATTRM